MKQQNSFEEIVVVGDAVEIITFRNYLGDKTKWIIEETALRIRMVVERSEIPFLDSFNARIRRADNTNVVYVFLHPRNVNENADVLARSLNR